MRYPDWVDDAHIQMGENDRRVFTERYLRKDEHGNPVETIAECFYRVAANIARPEGLVTRHDSVVRDYYDLLSSFRFLPNTPTFTGAGTPLGQLAACFVLPIEDDMESIFDTLKNAALIQQSGGGVGFSFSRIRPRNALIKRSMGRATGPVGFMRVFDAAFGEIAQGGTRRGANMAILRVDHPDIYEFIDCKATEGDITNFNISVAVTDEFMRAVRDGTEYFDLRDPKTGKVVKTVETAKLYDKIIQAAHRNGEPGAVFIDTANAENPLPEHYTLEATNPCGEQWLGPYENCCLGSINLAKFVRDGAVDWEGLKQTVRLSTWFLDDVVSANKYIPAVPQLKEAAMLSRRIGLGFMGLADMFYMTGVRYGSDRAVDLASQVTEFIRYHAMLTSINIASFGSDEKINESLKEEPPGAFSAFNDSIYKDSHDYRWEFDKAYEPAEDWGRPQLDWEHVGDDDQKLGVTQFDSTNGCSHWHAGNGG